MYGHCEAGWAEEDVVFSEFKLVSACIKCCTVYLQRKEKKSSIENKPTFYFWRAVRETMGSMGHSNQTSACCLLGALAAPGFTLTGSKQEEETGAHKHWQEGI